MHPVLDTRDEVELPTTPLDLPGTQGHEGTEEQ